MKNTLITIALSLIAVSAHAADSRAAAVAIVTKALECNIRDGKATSVLKALKALGAKPAKVKYRYILPSPISVFGFDVTMINVWANGEGSVDEDGEGYDGDVYSAIFPKVSARLVAIATAARLSDATDGSYYRDTKSGQLRAYVNEGSDVWLVCTPR
ncbi:MAG: hypothetical protein FWD62_02850 [Betaproteobacteria bacterium]|nr:hypothetical protein [Betaproteobacteria bacterium]